MSEVELLEKLISGVGIFIGVIFILFLAVLIPVIIAQWKLFKKAGKNGWEAIVPVYNTWVLIEISGLHWWYFLVSIGLSLLSVMIPSLSFVFAIASYYLNFIVYYNIAKKTKQNEILYGILGTFVAFVAVLILGFNKNITYDSSIEVSPNGVF